MRRPCQKRETSLDRSLDRVREVHRKALSAAATLEEEIKKLHQIRGCSELDIRPKSWHHQRSEGMWEARCCKASFTSKPNPSQSADPDMPPGEMESEDGTSNLGELPKLKAEVASFLQGSSETSDGEGEEMPLELAVLKFANWVRWKVGKCNIPSCWVELSTVLGEDDTRRLAQEVRASFQLPRQMHELEPEEAHFQAPLALPCLHCWRFIPLVISIYTSQDIREIPRKKVVVYARALQHFAEQNNLPKKQCLLAESILELRKEVGFYLSFTDEEVF